MATEVEIANMALMLCGAESITALTDSNERARAINTAWPFVRRSVLASHPWNNPTKRTQLDADATAPSWGYTTRYLLPSDCVRVLDFDTLEDWDVEAGFIVTNESSDDIGIRYIYDEDDPSNFDPHLTSTLALFLAHEVMYRLNADKTHQDRVIARVEAFNRESKNIDAQQQTALEIEDDDWITVRN